MNIASCCENVENLLKAEKVEKTIISKIIATIKSIDVGKLENKAFPRNESDYIFKIGPKKKDHRSVGAVSNGEGETIIKRNKGN